jgi:hypothetical protein
MSCSIRRRGRARKRLSDSSLAGAEVEARGAFDQDRHETPHRPAIESFIPPVHGLLDGLGGQLRELLPQPRHDP